MSLQYGAEETPLAGSYGAADSFPKDFGYGVEEEEEEAAAGGGGGAGASGGCGPGGADSSKPRILLMGLRRSGKSSIQKVSAPRRASRPRSRSARGAQVAAAREARRGWRPGPTSRRTVHACERGAWAPPARGPGPGPPTPDSSGPGPSGARRRRWLEGGGRCRAPPYISALWVAAPVAALRKPTRPLRFSRGELGERALLLLLTSVTRVFWEPRPSLGPQQLQKELWQRHWAAKYLLLLVW